MWEALLGEDHTPLDLLVTDKERLRLSCSVTKYKGDRTRKTDRIADRHVKIVTSKMSHARVGVGERVVLLHSQRKHKGRGERTFESMVVNGLSHLL